MPDKTACRTPWILETQTIKPGVTKMPVDILQSLLKQAVSRILKVIAEAHRPKGKRFRKR